MLDRFLISFVAIVLIASCVFLCIAIPASIDRTDRAEQIAKDSNCAYLGSPRDLHTVHFMDCDGTVKPYRVK